MPRLPPVSLFLSSSQFVSVANITYPNIYQGFLDAVDLVNLDLGWVLQAECLINVTFHQRLILSTVGPLLGLAVIGAAYAVARRRHLCSEGPLSWTPLTAVNQKYLSMVLLLTFVVYSSVSSVLFQTFSCDPLDDGYRYLRADYRIRCDSPTHRALQVYAGCMILLYTAGIPVFYATLLLKRHKVLMDVGLRDMDPTARSMSTLWNLYKPRRFYYELVECARRVLLAGVVVFMYPDTVAQVGIALMIAASFMVLCDVLAPYESVWDAWVSRLGHVIVFSSIYLALLLRIDVSNERLASQKAYEAILVAAHVVMVVIVLVQAMVMSLNWFRRKIRPGVKMQVFLP